MKTNSSLLLFLLCIFTSSAQISQNPIIHISFDEPQREEIQRNIDSTSTAHSTQEVFATARCEGIKGLALDLTDDVAIRVPKVLDLNNQLSYGEDNSFSMQLWVQTKKGAQQGTAIMSNKKWNDSKSSGWTLGTKENGAWYWQVSDGTTEYSYEPTAQRQAINDGAWHQLTITINRTRNEMWMYLDGKNVAIYRINGLKSLESELRTVIGGTDEYMDWSSRGEWTAFNGRIDEVKFWNRAITADEVAENYQTNLGTTKSLSISSMSNKLKIQSWNIWHGGHRHGQHVGVSRVIDVLKSENADIIGLVETYGSGAIIADSLDYYFYLISTNLSIMSRYPIDECIDIFKPFNSGGAILNLGNNRKLAFFDIWLNWRPNVCDLIEGNTVAENIVENERETRLYEIDTILKEMKPYIDNANEIPVMMAGDFNSGSHLDWTNEFKGIHNDMVIEWPVSQSMLKAGFKDSFRELNPNVFNAPGFTWSPLINPFNPDCIHDRIDFIYYKGTNLAPVHSETINHHPVFWPSDHGSVVTHFYYY